MKLATLLLACLLPIMTNAETMPPMKITCPDFSEGGLIPSKFTSDGANVNPEIDIVGVPAKTKSLALIVDDPDAPAGNWNHWLLWNMDPATTQIAENSAPPGSIQGRSDFGPAKYLGPSPPSGTHRYFFRLLALDTKLSLAAGSGLAALDNAMTGHVLMTAELMGHYKRSR